MLKKEQAQNTRQLLLESARLLFAENGYKGTSVRSINRRVNLADGLLYHYFPGGKKELFKTIVTESFRKIHSELENDMNCEKNNEIAMEDFLLERFKMFAKTVESNIDIIRIIVKENDVQEFVSAEEILALTNCNRNFFAEFLRKRAQQNEIEEIDFDVAASTIVAALINYILLKVMGINTKEIASDEKIKRIVNYHLNLWKKR